MSLSLKELTLNISEINTDDILSCWQWAIEDMVAITLISSLGDIFFIGKDNCVHWLQCDCGTLTMVANDIQHFKELLQDDEYIDNWFLPNLVKKLIEAGKVLKENQVYSYTIIPAIGGAYSLDNIEPTDISVHFALSGQICQQIKDLPDGTSVKIVLKNKPSH